MKEIDEFKRWHIEVNNSTVLFQMDFWSDNRIRKYSVYIHGVHTQDKNHTDQYNREEWREVLELQLRNFFPAGKELGSVVSAIYEPT